MNIPILSFIKRYYLLIIAAVALIALAASDKVFQTIGTFSYVPALGLLAHLSALFARHLFYASTIDQDAADGTFKTEWRSITPFQRVLLSIVVFSTMFLGLCIIASSIAK